MLSVVSMLLPEELTAAFPVARPFLVVLIGAMVSLENVKGYLKCVGYTCVA